ncbi:MAG: TAXI family TRAP transporter solute-binding subunit [Caldisericia bacterium]|nr:TAXI family TRAP transporter solute-binding subunit [Caldisericia bacterium]
MIISKRAIGILLILMLVVSLVSLSFFSACAPKEEKPQEEEGVKKVFFGIATGGTGGTYFPVGGAIAQVVSNFADYDNVDVVATAQTSGASVANCNLIGKHEIESAFAQNNVVYWAYTGTEIFKDKEPIKNLRVIASLYPETIQIVALKKSGIKTVEDLKGKKVAVGDVGSGTEVDARTILNLHGITYDDIDEQYMSFSEATDALKDERIDAAFVTAGYPTSSIVSLATTKDIVLVNITPEMVQKLVKEVPYYAPATIPAGTYKGQDEDVTTVTCLAQWVCDADLDEDLVYNVTKALWEHRDFVEKVHAKGKDITLETALDGVAIPLHPGAEKYYKEKGLIH